MEKISKELLTEKGMSKNYKNDYSKRVVTKQPEEFDFKISRDSNGEFEAQIIE